MNLQIKIEEANNLKKLCVTQLSDINETLQSKTAKENEVN